MLHIYCPYCQASLEEEDFSYAGEALIERPKKPEDISDEAWGDYLFMRSNSKGNYLEQWNHSAGCRKYFIAERNTIDNTITGTWPMSEASTLRARSQTSQAPASDEDN